MKILPLLSLVVVGLFAASDWAVAEEPVRREWTVEGLAREALVAVPAEAKTKPAPVIFAFHGHGGNMRVSARKFAYHTLWPEALVVYPQGVPTPGRLTDPEGKKTGWQSAAGDHGDRDLKFFDAILATLRREFRVDDRRIYVTGHSNGGGFSYLLWSARGDQLAAVAPCAAVFREAKTLAPKPVLHLAGENDPLVKYAWQQAMIAAVKKINQCGEGQPWGEFCTRYPSAVNAPVVTYIHPGGHEVPAGAPAAIVKFFREQAKP
jgi:polyhydroxybutyrate depolymerase